MLEAEVPQLVGENGLDFLVRETFQQGVEENDALIVADAGELGIAVGGAARVVDYEDAL